MTGWLKDNQSLKEELEELYWDKGLSEERIARIKGVAQITISKWFRKHGIPTRSKSKALRLYLAKHEHWNKGKGIRVHPDLHMSTDLAYILGVLRGDGHVSTAKDSWRIVLHQTREAFARSFEKTLKKIGLNAGTMTIIVDGKKQYVTRACSAEFAKWYKSLNLDDIEKLVISKRDYIVAFVRGFFESEGYNYIGKRGPRGGFRWDLSMACKNYELIAMVQRMLNLLGYHFSIYKNSQTGAYSLKSWEKSANYRFLEEVTPCIKNNIPSRLSETCIRSK